MTESNGEHASPLPPRIHTPTPPKTHSDQLRARLRTTRTHEQTPRQRFKLSKPHTHIVLHVFKFQKMLMYVSYIVHIKCAVYYYTGYDILYSSEAKPCVSFIIHHVKCIMYCRLHIFQSTMQKVQSK